MTRLCLTWMSMAAVLLMAGCGRRGNVDLLEGRLRQQEQQLMALQSELDSHQQQLTVARREADALRSQLTVQGQETLLPEQARVLYAAEGIRFHRLLTGGLDRDDRPGDELLTALLIPYDADGELVKLPGRIELVLLDLSLSEGRQQIARWEFDADESRRHWHQGFIGSGYLFRLPWQHPPQSSELVLHARMTSPDGRRFETNQLISVIPPTGNGKIDPGNAEEERDENLVPEPFDRPADRIQNPTADRSTISEQRTDFRRNQSAPSGAEPAGTFPEEPFAPFASELDEEAEPADLPVRNNPPLLPGSIENSSDRWTDETIPYLR